MAQDRGEAKVVGYDLDIMRVNQDTIDFINAKLTLLTPGSNYPGDNYHACPVFL